jgi:hypothetical protein
MPTPKKPNLPFLDDDQPAHDADTAETAPLQVDHSPGLNDEDDEATVAVPPVDVTPPSTPRTNRR